MFSRAFDLGVFGDGCDCIGLFNSSSVSASISRMILIQQQETSLHLDLNNWLVMVINKPATIPTKVDQKISLNLQEVIKLI